jgi:hypothetical protein
MSDVDDKIRQALEAEAANEGDGEGGYFEMIADTFRGNLRWLAILVWIEMIAFGGAAVVFAVLFFCVDAVREWILYANLCLGTAMVLSLLKLGYWLRINRNSLAREVKRLEIEVRSLRLSLERPPGGTKEDG